MDEHAQSITFIHLLYYLFFFFKDLRIALNYPKLYVYII